MAADDEPGISTREERLQEDREERIPKSGVESRGWSETCIGIWSRSVTQKTSSKSTGSETKPICKGINIVRIAKDVDESKITTSLNTGITITITETVENSDTFENDSRGRQKKDALMEDASTSMFDSIFSSLTLRRENAVKQFRYYKDTPNGGKELLSDLQASSEKQLTTARRLLSYARPQEKLSQAYHLVGGLYQAAKDWMSNRR